MISISRRPGRRTRTAIASLAAAALTMGALTGCSLTNPATTRMEYDASDGVSHKVGAVTARNLILVSPRADSTGTLAGYLVNESGEDAELTIGLTQGEGVTVVVPAHGTLRLEDNDGKPVSAPGSPAAGGWTTVLFADAAGSSYPVRVPVLPKSGVYETIGGK